MNHISLAIRTASLKLKNAIQLERYSVLLEVLCTFYSIILYPPYWRTHSIYGKCLNYSPLMDYQLLELSKFLAPIPEINLQFFCQQEGDHTAVHYVGSQVTCEKIKVLCPTEKFVG